jgi:zeta-carotene desaturase
MSHDRVGEALPDFMPVAIAGGGLAGIACAVALARRGVPSIILESRQRLGGRATSHVDPATGELIDNCQHVALGCCHRYRALCQTLGVDADFAWTTAQTWIEPGGRRSRIAPAPLPAPAHFAPSFASARFLSTRSKAEIAWALSVVSRSCLGPWRGRAFGEFLDETGQGAEARARFWEPVLVSACNLAASRADASLALKVFRDGFLASRGAAAVGVPSVPLASLYRAVPEVVGRASCRYGRGAVRTGASVSRVDATSVTLADGRGVRASVVVCALAPERAADVVAMDARDERFDAWSRMGHSPILGVHAWFDRRVLDVPHAVLVGEGLGIQWLFAKRAGPRGAEEPASGQSLHAVVSAADEWMALPESAIADRLRRDVAATLGEDAAKALVRVKAIKERRATFACTPEFERERPGVAGAGGVVLASDATDTGWPATMEGAVRSGEAAACHALARLTRR